MASTAPPIVEWDQLEGDFERPDILLGNGFSISVDGRFSYGSLFRQFLDALDEQADRDRFESLGSQNFEYLLESFSRASWINEAFGIPTEPLAHAWEVLRNGLIEAVGHVHPKFGEINQDALKRLCDQLGPFEDIYTTNYDALLYHIIMLAKDRYEADRSLRPYNDYFWEVRDSDFLEFRDYQNYRHFRHIYYLHGALFLFSQPDADVKLRRGGRWTELIEVIGRKIRQGDIPLFVSEGTAAEKRAAIHRSEYLSFAMEKLRKGTRPVAVFGFGFSDPDEHIAEALIERRCPIAVAIREEGRTYEESVQARLQVLSKLPGADVRFFSSGTLFTNEVSDDAEPLD